VSAGAHSTEDTRKAMRALTSMALVFAVLAGATVAVRAAYGHFADDVEVSTRLPRAGQALRPGSDVKYRGVNVGKVRSVKLRDRQVDVVLGLHDDARIPVGTKVSVRSKTVFGEKYVAFEPREGDDGPFLQDGDLVEATGTGIEVEHLLDTSDDLFRGIDQEELAVLMDELVQASHGEGDRVADLIDRSGRGT
jgi:phospholipid/cholesterol/gamma-HCH transport system substrate-binding protein